MSCVMENYESWSDCKLMFVSGAKGGTLIPLVLGAGSGPRRECRALVRVRCLVRRVRRARVLALR